MSNVSAKNSQRVKDVGAVIGQHLEEIAALFAPDMKLTFIARDPERVDGTRDMVLTNDSLPAVVVALNVRVAEESKTTPARGATA